MEKKVKKMRPPLPGKQEFIDWNVVNSALQAGCSGAEIASKLNMSVATLARGCQNKFNMSWTEYASIKAGEGDLLLKMKMFQLAMSGDKTMLIFLAKTRLGMVEQQKIEITTIPQIAWSDVVQINTDEQDSTNGKAEISGLLP